MARQARTATQGTRAKRSLSLRAEAGAATRSIQMDGPTASKPLSRLANAFVHEAMHGDIVEGQEQMKSLLWDAAGLLQEGDPEVRLNYLFNALSLVGLGIGREARRLEPSRSPEQSLEFARRIGSVFALLRDVLAQIEADTRACGVASDKGND